MDSSISSIMSIRSSSGSSSSSSTVLPLSSSSHHAQHDFEKEHRSSTLNYASVVLDLQAELKEQTKNVSYDINKQLSGLEEFVVSSSSGGIAAYLSLISASWIYWLMLALIIPALVLEVWELILFSAITTKAQEAASNATDKPLVTAALRIQFENLKARRARMQLLFGQGICMGIGWYRFATNLVGQKAGVAAMNLGVCFLVWSIWTFMFQQKAGGSKKSKSHKKSRVKSKQSGRSLSNDSHHRRRSKHYYHDHSRRREMY